MNKILLQNNEGFVLVLGLLLMLVLAIVGTLATRTSVIELQIAGNDRNYQSNFLESDGGTQIAIRLLEDNFDCAKGFSATSIGDINDPMEIAIEEQNLYKNKLPLKTDGTEDLRWPKSKAYATSSDVTRVNMAGKVIYTAGSAIQMAAGYEGVGKGAAVGGAYYDHQIQADKKGQRNGVTSVLIHWFHRIGTEEKCNY